MSRTDVVVLVVVVVILLLLLLLAVVVMSRTNTSYLPTPLGRIHPHMQLSPLRIHPVLLLDSPGLPQPGGQAALPRLAAKSKKHRGKYTNNSTTHQGCCNLAGKLLGLAQPPLPHTSNTLATH